MKRLSREQISRATRDEEAMPRLKKKKAPKSLALAPEEAEPAAVLVDSGDLPVVKREGGAPVKIWTRQLEASAWRQLSHLSRLPFIHPKGIAVMPDVHVGNGACVGSVLPLRQALVPAAVGLDIGCGMVAVELGLNANQLPDNLRALRLAIEEKIPLGSGGTHAEPHLGAWQPLESGYEKLREKHPRLFKKSADQQLGTLGAGNHFVEVCLDERSHVWVMLHSGSRGVGAVIGQYFIDKAHRRTLMQGEGKLGWLPQEDPLFDDYYQAVLWAQDYARSNRAVMLEATLNAISTHLRKPIEIKHEAINCHHNYVSRERHFGEDLWITRKGAIQAQAGALAVIPGSMGAESFIVRGKGNAESYCSCSHGAGRKMSRALAREQFSTQDLKKQTASVECRKDRAIIDEIPASYKPIRQVMAEQQDLVEVVHTLKQVICIKGC